MSAELILYACPSGPLAQQIKNYFDLAKARYSWNPANDYMPHCSLTGFFHDSEKESVIGISFGSDDRVIQLMEAVNAQLLRRVKKIRMFGATGLDLSLVAKGTLSGLVQLNVQTWDFAAARLILSESGATFEARPNEIGGWQILAAPQPLFGQLKAIIDAANTEDFIRAN